MSFKEMLVDDVDKVFINKTEFGETATLVRGKSTCTLNVLYDELPLNGENMGSGIDAISHNPRLFVSASALPDGRPRKGDVFLISAGELHPVAKRLVAKDFEYPKDGVVVYYLKETPA